MMELLSILLATPIMGLDGKGELESSGDEVAGASLEEGIACEPADRLSFVEDKAEPPGLFMAP